MLSNFINISAHFTFITGCIVKLTLVNNISKLAPGVIQTLNKSLKLPRLRDAH